MAKAPAVSWVSVLVGTILLQVVSSFLLRTAPTIAPFLTATAGLSPAAIGHLSAVSTIGAIAFLLIGTPLIRRTGSLRALQLGVALAAAGALLYAIPSPVAVVVGTLLIGVGYGPSPAAGSDVLQRFAPPAQRNLIFSVKQAGVPLGGALAGFLLPVLLEHSGITGVATVSLIAALLVIAAVQPLRTEIDHARETTPVSLARVVSASNLLTPFRAVAATPALLRLALAGLCFSACQGTWFAFLVTFLVVTQGYSLALAGVVFAMTQLTGIFGRIVLGWAADRVGSGRVVLSAMGIASAVCSFVLALSSTVWPAWSMLLLASVAGVAVSSWNGVHIAETIKLAEGDVHTAAAGATAITFCGYLLAPALFTLLAMRDHYDLGFALIAVVGLVGATLARERPERRT